MSANCPSVWVSVPAFTYQGEVVYCLWDAKRKVWVTPK